MLSSLLILPVISSKLFYEILDFRVSNEWMLIVIKERIFSIIKNKLSINRDNSYNKEKKSEKRKKQLREV